MLLDKAASGMRDDILAAINDAGLMARPAWTLMHRLPPYAGCSSMELPVLVSPERRIVNLPSSSQLFIGPQ